MKIKHNQIGKTANNVFENDVYTPILPLVSRLSGNEEAHSVA
jgi:hypothetical protein